MVDLYGINTPDVHNLLELAQKHEQDLDTWREKASVLIDAEEGTLQDSEELQCIAGILLAYQNAIILLYRPFLLVQKPAASVNNAIDPILQQNDAVLAEEWPKQQVDGYVSMLLKA